MQGRTVTGNSCRHRRGIERLPKSQKFITLNAYCDHLKKIVIAIDGPAASGKSTTARLVAERLGYLHIETGAMYRAITLRVLEFGVSPDDVEGVRTVAEMTNVRLHPGNGTNKVMIGNRDVTEAIRSPEVTGNVSLVSSYQPVREILVRAQRKMAAEGGVVLEGRDIGTVVLPNADLKVFMVANVGERARRRKKDLEVSGIPTDEEAVVREIVDRDQKDSTRDVSPLRKAEDAIELDTSHLTIEEQVDFIVAKAREILEKGKKR